MLTSSSQTRWKNLIFLCRFVYNALWRDALTVNWWRLRKGISAANASKYEVHFSEEKTSLYIFALHFFKKIRTLIGKSFNCSSKQFLFLRQSHLCSEINQMMQTLSLEKNPSNWTENQFRCLDCFSLLSSSKTNDIEDRFCSQSSCDKYFPHIKMNHLLKRYIHLSQWICNKIKD